jgi:hypothetical protein
MYYHTISHFHGSKLVKENENEKKEYENEDKESGEENNYSLNTTMACVTCYYSSNISRICKFIGNSDVQ